MPGVQGPGRSESRRAVERRGVDVESLRGFFRLDRAAGGAVASRIRVELLLLRRLHAAAHDTSRAGDESLRHDCADSLLPTASHRRAGLHEPRATVDDDRWLGGRVETARLLQLHVRPRGRDIADVQVYGVPEGVSISRGQGTD